MNSTLELDEQDTLSISKNIFGETVEASEDGEFISFGGVVSF